MSNPMKDVKTSELPIKHGSINVDLSLRENMSDFYVKYPDLFLENYLGVKFNWTQRIILRSFNLTKKKEK